MKLLLLLLIWLIIIAAHHEILRDIFVGSGALCMDECRGRNEVSVDNFHKNFCTFFYFSKINLQNHSSDESPLLKAIDQDDVDAVEKLIEADETAMKNTGLLIAASKSKLFMKLLGGLSP